MLVAKGLRKRYKQREVVKEFGLTLDAGEVVGLLGPNGAGKTTCFYMIVGLVEADAGSIVLDGKDITADPMYTRAKQGVGYLPQEPSVFRKLTVADNLRLVLELREDLDKAGREKELNLLLDELQINHVADQLGASLSGGERRRCEIARALAAKPRLILLDEPFAGVDPISVGEIQRIVLHLKQRGIGVLITDHNVRETLAVCERAYIVSQGHLIATKAAYWRRGHQTRSWKTQTSAACTLERPSSSDRRPLQPLPSVRHRHESTAADIAGTTTGHDAAAASGHQAVADVQRRTGTGDRRGGGNQPAAGLGRKRRTHPGCRAGQR